MFQKSKDKTLSSKLNEIKIILKTAIELNKKIFSVFSDPELLSKVDKVKEISKFMFNNRNKLVTNNLVIINKLESIIEIVISSQNKNENILSELVY